ncbi:MAG: hypothetical protein ACRYG7_54410 [Janthinobacterium lividum]
MPTPTQLAARHLKLTFWGGLVLVAPLSFVVALDMEGGRSWPGELPLALRLLRTTFGIMGVLALWAALPAWLAGWLRLRPMRWLFEWLRQQPARRSWLVGVGGTLLLFLGTVLLGALLLYLVGRGQTQISLLLRICSGFSLPWLLASLWATWRVLQPHAEEVA